MSKDLLSYLNLSDRYERKARFLPALLTLVLLAPPFVVLGFPVSGWVTSLLSGGGLSAVIAVFLSHLASAFGNRYQQKVWPDWPHDSPTNVWLRPEDSSRSKQQKQIWYRAIERLTGLNVEAAIESNEPNEVRATINDAIAGIRNRLWSLEATKRLKLHNEDYGFARNLAGLRCVWVVFSSLSSVACWALLYSSNGELLWAVVSTAGLVVSIVLGYFVLPGYVERKAYHYAESFFAALVELDSCSGGETVGRPTSDWSGH